MTTQGMPFLSTLQEAFECVRGTDSLSTLREKAFDHFLELGLPESVPLRALYEQTFSSKPASEKSCLEGLIYPESAHCHFVFINGAFEPALSDWQALPSQVVVLPLTDALRSYGTFLQNRWSKTLKEEIDPFAILNLALHPQGLFLYVPPKLVVEAPIQFIFINTSDETLSFPRLHFFAAQKSHVQCAVTKSGGGLTCDVTDFALEEGAQLTHYKANFSGLQMSSLRATLKRESVFKSVAAALGSQLSYDNYHVTLLGENSEVNLQGIWKLCQKQQAHTTITIDHRAPHTRSMQKFKGVLSDFSKSSFEGKILVQTGAHKTEAYQLNHNLILGEHAVAASKPNLEIFEDDVKASHGATVSQLGEEEIFYLKSRGISELEARRLLLKGFCKEILDQIELSSLSEELKGYV